MTVRQPLGSTLPFTAIKAVSRPQEVSSQILAAIRDGHLGPGDPVPSERELMEAFGVSRVSVREAIRSLEAIGVIEVFHGRGSFVSRGPATRYREPFAHWLSVHRDEIDALLKVRGALDELACEEAALTAGDEESVAEIARCEQAFAACAAQPDPDPEELADLDIDFHLAIAGASGSQLLLELLRDLNENLMESRRAGLAPAGRPRQSAREHHAILARIAAGDPRKARAASHRHMRASRNVLTAALEIESDDAAS
jgi:DNA-binding FadR family transcriptional regulator